METGSFITMPPYPLSNRVWDWHLVGARTTVDLNGIADAATFDALLRKTRRRGKRRRKRKSS